MGRFDDRATQPARGPGDILRWKVLDRLAGRGTARGAGLDGPAPRRDNDGAAVRATSPSLTWVGHATFALRLGAKLVVTDPVWSTRIQGVVGRLVAPGVALDAVGPVDVVLISHGHYDHLDLPTLARIGPAAQYVVPAGLGDTLRRAGLPKVVELDWWQSWSDGDLSVTLTPARHWSMRTPWDRNDSLWGGWVLRGPEGAAYHAGDTGYSAEMFREIGARFDDIDWAMLPIGAYEPRWFMQPQHMNPEDAVEAFSRLGAKTFVAMHWGTFKLTDEPTLDPPARVRALWTERALDPSRLWVMDVGETRALTR